MPVGVSARVPEGTLFFQSSQRARGSRPMGDNSRQVVPLRPDHENRGYGCSMWGTDRQKDRPSGSDFTEAQLREGLSGLVSLDSVAWGPEGCPAPHALPAACVPRPAKGPRTHNAVCHSLIDARGAPSWCSALPKGRWEHRSVMTFLSVQLPCRAGQEEGTCCCSQIWESNPHHLPVHPEAWPRPVSDLCCVTDRGNFVMLVRS